MPETSDAPIPAGQFLGPPAGAAPLAPTSPPVTPNRSKDVIDSDIAALRDKIAGVVDVRERPAMVDRMHKLYQEREGAGNRVHVTLGAEPGEHRPELDPTPAYFDPGPPRAGVTRDAQDVETVGALGRTYDIPPADLRTAFQDYEAALARGGDQWEAGIRELVPRWGPSAEGQVDLQVDRIKWALAHLPAPQGQKLQPLAEAGHPRVLRMLLAYYGWQHHRP